MHHGCGAARGCQRRQDVPGEKLGLPGRDHGSRDDHPHHPAGRHPDHGSHRGGTSDPRRNEQPRAGVGQQQFAVHLRRLGGGIAHGVRQKAAAEVQDLRRDQGVHPELPPGGVLQYHDRRVQGEESR